MTTIELFLLTLFTAGVTLVSYKSYALRQGWPIGKMYYQDGGLPFILGILSILGSFITAFFFVKWYFVLGGAIVGWLLSGAITGLFASLTQYLALLLFVISFVILFFK